LRDRRLIAVAAATILLLAGGVLIPLLGDPNSQAQAALAGGTTSSTAPELAADTEALDRPRAATTAGRTVERASKTVRGRQKVARKPRPEFGIGLLVGPTWRCLDVRDGVNVDGAVVQLYSCNGSEAQIWTSAEDRTVRAFDKCLDSAPGTVVITTCTGADTQQWQLINGRIRSPTSKQCLAVVDTPADLAPIAPVPCSAPRTPAPTDSTDPDANPEPNSTQRWQLTTS
jgi:hypothetical protein